MPRQIAAVLGKSLAEAASWFDEFLAEGWRECGVTPLEIKELCRRQGRAYYFLNGHRMLDTFEPTAKSRLKSIALTSWDGHAYLYASARAVCTRHLAGSEQTVPARLTNEAHYEMPPISAWKLWAGIASPGYFHTDDLSAARSQLLLSGRSPKVILRSAATADPVALRYMCLKAVDGETGVCVIRELPVDRVSFFCRISRLKSCGAARGFRA